MAKKSTSSRAAKSPNLIVSEPVSLLQRDLKADAGGLFKALGRSIVHIGTGKYWELAGDVSDAAAALGLKADPGGLTWYLIRRSLQKAMLSLVEEAWLHRVEDSPKPSEALGEQLDKEVSKAKLEVSAAFFRQPGSLPFVENCAAWFHQWLVGAGFDQPKASSISSRLRSYFVYALNQEWRAHPDLYAPIISASSTPFTQAGERERAWDQYRSWLDQELDGPMFGEPFSLRQLYVPLRAYYHRMPKGLTETPAARTTEDKGKRIAVELSGTLIEWVRRTERDDAVRVISGGPGSGKSSVAKMFTAEALKQTDWCSLYIPLHHIKYKGEVVPAIHDYLERTKLLPGAATPLAAETAESKLLLIFDGLDELAMLGKIAQGTASEFVRAIKDLVRDQNMTSLRLKVVLTGRTVVMQSLETEFRREGAVLHLCPYYIPVTVENKKQYERGWQLLAKNDQRQQWWKSYGKVTGQDYQGLPEHFNSDGLIEVSSEPLLNYLLALANQAKMLDFKKEVTENHIYAILIHEVYDRRWSDGKHFSVQGMNEDHFQRVLEEIAVAAWHGDGRKTTVAEIKQHCDDAGIMRMLEVFQDGAESGVLRLLTAFFFRQSGVRDDENAFEFTHKSFGEYLVARRVVRLLDDMQDMTLRQRTKFNGWDERTCLEKWARLCGPTALNPRQWGFLKNEMHRTDATPDQWQLLLATLIDTMLRKGMPIEKLMLPDYRAMREQARNAEESLLVTLNACALITKKLSKIDWPEETSAGGWIKRLQDQRGGQENVLVSACLSWLILDGQIMHMADFYFANLVNSSLRNVVAALSVVWQADMMNADLFGSRLNDSNLQRVDLRHANLQNAQFHNSNLQNAQLQYSNLQDARFEDANLEGANLENAELSGANFKRANLKNAHFNGAALDGVDFEGADLQDAEGLPADLLDTAKIEK